MAGFVVSPNTIKILLHWTYETRPQLCVLHAEYTTSGPLNPNIAETLFSALKANWTAANGPGPHSITGMQFSGVGVLDLRAPNIPEVRSTSAAVSGTGTGTPVPAQCSVVVTKRTALTGRSHRGRIYLFGWDSSAVATDGTISDIAATNATAFGFAISNAINSVGAVLAVSSPALPERPAHDGSTLPAKPYEITPVTNLEVRDRIWDTNRRRLDTLRR